MTDTTTGKPYNAFLTPSPFRIPVIIVFTAAIVIGFGMLAVGHFSGSTTTSGSLPMLVLIGLP